MRHQTYLWNPVRQRVPRQHLKSNWWHTFLSKNNGKAPKTICTFNKLKSWWVHINFHLHQQLHLKCTLPAVMHFECIERDQASMNGPWYTFNQTIEFNSLIHSKNSLIHSSENRILLLAQLLSTSLIQCLIGTITNKYKNATVEKPTDGVWMFIRNKLQVGNNSSYVRVNINSAKLRGQSTLNANKILGSNMLSK